MRPVLLLLFPCLFLAIDGDITYNRPRSGSCLCIKGSTVNVRSSGKKTMYNLKNIEHIQYCLVSFISLNCV